MPDTITLRATPRQATKAKALRREGWVPGVIYGRGSEAVSLQFERRALEVAAMQAGANRLLMLTIEGGSGEEMALFRDVQRDPVTNVVQHVDLYSVVAGQTITSTVPVITMGYAPVTLEGGSVSQLVSELDIECLPKDLPSAIMVDVSVLVAMDSAISFDDLDIPLGVTVLNPPEGDIVRVYEPRGPAPEEEEALDTLGLGEGIEYGAASAAEEETAEE
jgi:large subunit ribosomal protein L25